MCIMCHCALGIWSRRDWSVSVRIHSCLHAYSDDLWQWRSSVGCWLRQSSHSTAHHWTWTGTRPRWQSLSSQAAVAGTFLLQWTNVTAVRCAWQRAWDCHFSIQFAIGDELLVGRKSVLLISFVLHYNECRLNWRDPTLSKHADTTYFVTFHTFNTVINVDCTEVWSVADVRWCAISHNSLLQTY